MTQRNIWERFDYERMAGEARNERDKLWAILKRRMAEGPREPEGRMEWDQKNRRYYGMYLEQRKNTKEFERRAQERRSYAA